MEWNSYWNKEEAIDKKPHLIVDKKLAVILMLMQAVLTSIKQVTVITVSQQIHVIFPITHSFTPKPPLIE